MTTLLLGTEQKKFEHDCTECKFLAHLQGERPTDLYICNEFTPTLLARYSDEPSNNATMPIELYNKFKDSYKDHPMGYAYALANMQGHID